MQSSVVATKFQLYTCLLLAYSNSAQKVSNLKYIAENLLKKMKAGLRGCYVGVTYKSFPLFAANVGAMRNHSESFFLFPFYLFIFP